ncbi:hypothetical protein KC721_04360 [Candidatus Woesebacteria bacterium]|nr:hypothetical protein [Candidatus Woesebacteria bacterium]
MKNVYYILCIALLVLGFAGLIIPAITIYVVGFAGIVLAISLPFSAYALITAFLFKNKSTQGYFAILLTIVTIIVMGLV